MSKIELSLVVPAYTIYKELEEMTLHCIASYRAYVDEVILVEDGGIFSKELKDASDVYIYYKDNAGFTKNVNRGWEVARGDFVAIVSSDTHLLSGNLRDICVPGKVTSPTIGNQHIPFLAGPFWCTPREVTEDRGMLLEEMHTYCSDSEYDHRVRDIFQKVESVKIFHKMEATVKLAGIEGGEQQRKDREVYNKLIKEGKAAC